MSAVPFVNSSIELRVRKRPTSHFLVSSRAQLNSRWQCCLHPSSNMRVKRSKTFYNSNLPPESPVAYSASFPYYFSSTATHSAKSTEQNPSDSGNQLIKPFIQSQGHVYRFIIYHIIQVMFSKPLCTLIRSILYDNKSWVLSVSVGQLFASPPPTHPPPHTPTSTRCPGGNLEGGGASGPVTPAHVKFDQTIKDIAHLHQIRHMKSSIFEQRLTTSKITTDIYIIINYVIIMINSNLCKHSKYSIILHHLIRFQIYSIISLS